MQAFVETIKAWQLHPVVDHFTVALIVVSILVDLVASLFPTRTWMRLMALSLMILGTAAAWGSAVTGGWEAGRVWENVNGPAMIVLKRHAWLGDKLPWVFLVLAVWRLGVQFTLFLDRARPIYMLVALIAGGLIIYQGSLGGRLVYEYGVGTALHAASGLDRVPGGIADANARGALTDPDRIQSECHADARSDRVADTVRESDAGSLTVADRESVGIGGHAGELAERGSITGSDANAQESITIGQCRCAPDTGRIETGTG